MPHKDPQIKLVQRLEMISLALRHAIDRAEMDQCAPLLSERELVILELERTPLHDEARTRLNQHMAQEHELVQSMVSAQATLINSLHQLQFQRNVSDAYRSPEAQSPSRAA